MSSEQRTPPVALVGSGAVAEAVAEAVADVMADAVPDTGTRAVTRVPDASGRDDELARAIDGPGVVVSAADTTSDAHHSGIRRACADNDATWLPVRTELGTLLIGPSEHHARSGCVECAALRRERATPDRQGRRAIRERHGDRLAEHPSAWLTGLALDSAAALVGAEVARLLDAPGEARTTRALLRLDLGTLDVARHQFLPDPFCPVCGCLPPDGPERARVALRPRPKPDPDTYRVRNVPAELDRLTELYVDAETGVLRPLEKGSLGGMTVTNAPLPLRFGDRTELGSGRTRDYPSSAVTAILEALERLGGVEPSGARSVVRATMAQLREHGHEPLDPRTLGFHPPACYQQPDFRFRPFDEHQQTRWVWGYSLVRDVPLLVPETCVYYSSTYAARHQDQPFVYEISNGCALGSCPEEAILYGILETVERDAFLLTWYARLPAPLIDPDSATDRTLPAQLAAIEHESGYRVLLFDTTMEHELPAVWAMGVRPDHADPDPSDSRPMSGSAAGAHLTLERAALAAMAELGSMLPDHVREYRNQADRVERMVRDPSLVRVMADHGPLYGNPAAFDRLRFLVDTPNRARLDDGRGCPDGFRNPDLTDDLRAVLDRLAGAGLDVVVVDQTTPEQRAGGFHCVKVLVPGMLPMTFGYDYRRIHGLSRPLTVPRRLGYRSSELRTADLNPHPHPFP